MREKNKKSQKRVLARILALILIFTMSVTPISPFLSEVQAASVENPWDGKTMTVPDLDEYGTYLIRTGAELAWFAAEVNRGNGEINGRLENYIYLNNYNTNHNWTMIGDTEENPYKGNFDGNGQKVVYMRAEITQKDPEHRYAGLFGVIDGGNVKNVTVLGKVLQNYGNYGLIGGSDELYVGSGGIAGYLKSGQITNCTNYARTTMDGEAMYRNSGGIVGICKGIVMRCTNEGKLSTIIGFAQNHVGGIAGLVYGANAQVTNCMNSATVQGYICVGGIAGAVKGGSEINASCNYGTIKANSTAGGIAGRVSTTGLYTDGTEKECAVRNVYSLGDMATYGTGTGAQMGGIVGEAGYDNWTQEKLPPRPVIENAYSTVQFSNNMNSRRGGIIGYLISGAYGTVYGLATPDKGLNPVGATSDRGIQILGEALMLTEAELKSAGMIEKLGNGFTMADTYDIQNNGYPKLVWQGLPSALLSAIDDSLMELNGWLTAANRKKYGKNYPRIEKLVKDYKDKLGAVINQEELDTVMEEARGKLKEVKPGIDADNELMEAIDNSIIALENYRSRLIDKHPDLTEGQKQNLDSVVSDYRKKMNAAETPEEVRLLLRDGRDTLDARIAGFEADKRLEELRADAIQQMTDYRADESYDSLWMFKIRLAREKALEVITQAKTAAEVTSGLAEGQNSIDAVIDQIPEAGAWDGKTLTEPAVSERGIYQITSGSELAWFANQVNTVQDAEGISGELCNDISLGFKNWKPIGNTKAYTGSFDGKGYQIRGLFIERADIYSGLFGQLRGKNQVIQNLSVSGTIQADGKVDYAGGVAAYVYGADSANQSQMINCHSSVSIRQDQIKALGGGSGGIVGYAANVAVSNCSNTGSVVIGPAGKGGISYAAGGLIGQIGPSVRLQTSYNAGTVQSSHTAGGLAGAVGGRGSEIYSSYNCGEISAKYNSGGLVGGAFTGSSIKWCYTSGSVNLNESGLKAGAIFGDFNPGDYEVLYALKRSDSQKIDLVGGSEDFSASGRFLESDALHSDDALNALNGGGSCFIRDYLEYQNGYPILSWQITVDDFRTGAVSALQNYKKAEDYSGENWSIIQQLIEEGTAQIQEAEDIETINAALTQARNMIDEVETKAESNDRELQAAKDNAIYEIEHYVDLSEYRDEEKTKILKYIEEARKYILMSLDLEEVTRHLNEAKANIDYEETAWEHEYNENRKAAEEVETYIGEIGEVIYIPYVKTSIQTARSAYDKLTDRQKELVTNVQVLLDAEAEWEKLEEEYEATEMDKEMAAIVDELIEAIGEVTADSKEAIDAARNAFDALTENQKVLVSYPGKLTEAEAAYNKLCASVVAGMIAAIGDITMDKWDVIAEAQRAYDELTDDQKALVNDYPVLQNAIATYQNLTVAQNVIEMIEAIGDVTLESRNVIMAAISAYNGLSGAQQELVHNYDMLEAATILYESLSAIQQVIKMIDQIGTVSQTSGPQLEAARSAYNNLTPDEQRRITNLSVLENAEAAFAALETPEVDNNDTPEEIPTNDKTLQEANKNNGDGGSGTENGETSGGEEDKENKEETAEACVGVDDNDDQDGGLPSWLEDELDGTNTEETANLAAEQKKTAARKRFLLVLGIILAVCMVTTGTFAVALRKSAHKRKEKRVHF